MVHVDDLSCVAIHTLRVLAVCVLSLPKYHNFVSYRRVKIK